MDFETTGPSLEHVKKESEYREKRFRALVDKLKEKGVWDEKIEDSGWSVGDIIEEMNIDDQGRGTSHGMQYLVDRLKESKSKDK